MLRAFLKDSVVYALPAFISRGLSLILLPLYTRVLNPEDFGALDFLIAFASIVNLTIALEVSQGVARFYSGEQNPTRRIVYASSALWFSIACYSIFCIFSFAFSKPLSVFVTGSENLQTGFKIGIVYICCNGIFYLIQNQLRWELRSRRYAVVSLLMTFVTAVVAVFLTYCFHMGIEGVLWGMVAGVTVSSGYGLLHLRSTFCFRFDWGCLREMLIFSVPLVPSGVSVWVSNYVDRLMINHYLSLDEVGVYGIGFRLASIVGLVMAGFQGALMPLIYTYHKEAETPRQLARIFRVFVAISLLTFLALVIFSKDIFIVAATPAFYSGSAVVIYLVPAVLLAQMYIFAPGIVIAKKTHLLMLINIGGAIFNAILCWLFVPILGIVGAALSTLLCYSFVFICYMIFSQRFYPVPHEWNRLVGGIVLAALLAVIVPELTQTTLTRWMLNGLALVVMAGLIVLLGLVRVDEISYVARELYARLRPFFVRSRG